DKKLPQAPGADAAVAEFLKKVASVPQRAPSAGRGRLIVALDATASREPTWDRACQIQAEMFQVTAALGGLDVQLAYYRGLGDFDASPWVADAAGLAQRMAAVRCLGGQTQIVRVLGHALGETAARKVNALVFVGDCMEEDIDALSRAAGALGLKGVPCFMFQEGDDPVAERAFQQVAKLTGGAWCRFDAGSAAQQRELLRADAVFAAGGRAALADHGKRSGGMALSLTHQLGQKK
ncbi:MAG: VWA domain-containing protein, partial [Rhodospirillales bacterium]